MCPLKFLFYNKYFILQANKSSGQLIFFNLKLHAGQHQPETRTLRIDLSIGKLVTLTKGVKSNNG